MNRLHTKIHINIGIKSLFCAMLSSTLLIDFLNGSLPALKLGVVFRVAIIFLCFLIAIKYNRHLFLKYAAILGFLFFNVSLSVILHGASALVDVNYAIKTMFFYLVTTSLAELNRRNKLTIEDVDKIIIWNLIYGPILYLAGIALGGRTSYQYAGASVGFKSNFLSLNSLNIAFLIMYIFAVSRFFGLGKRNWGLASAYVAVPLILLGTKTSFAMLVLCPLLFILLNIKKKSLIKGLKYFLIGCLILLPIAGPKILPSIQGAIERQLFLMEKRDFWTYLFSTRNVRIVAVIQEYLKTFSVLDLVPGRGYFDLHHFVAIYLNSSEPVLPIEMDFFDVFFSYGIPGLMFTYVFAVKTIFKARKTRKIGRIQGYYWSCVIILIYGVLAGHLFQEAISSTFYALSMAGLIISTRNMKNENGRHS